MTNQFILLVLFILFVLLLSSAISLDLKTDTIYKLQCQITGKVYIGSTTIGVELAMKNNKSMFEPYKRGIYKTNDRIFEVMANKDYNLTVLEIIFELANDTDFLINLKKRQKFYMKQVDNVINKNIPSRTASEYYVENLDHISQQKKEYYVDNKGVILQKRSEHYPQIKPSLMHKVTCEVCGIECAKGSLRMHNRSTRHLIALAKLNSGSDSGPLYQQQLNDLLDAHKVTCEVCGGQYTKGSVNMHNIGKRHLTALAKLNHFDASSSSET